VQCRKYTMSCGNGSRTWRGSIFHTRMLAEETEMARLLRQWGTALTCCSAGNQISRIYVVDLSDDT